MSDNDSGLTQQEQQAYLTALKTKQATQESSSAFRKLLSQTEQKANQVDEEGVNSSELPPPATPEEARAVIQALKTNKRTPQSDQAFQKILG